ncbi:hypothetical protein, partial [Streptomyces venezuelae]|uniref:hypothetical protein n=1 Tax=Streptomyces venezuelae TaxID=54571 RepID=UPI001F3970DD
PRLGPEPAPTRPLPGPGVPGADVAVGPCIGVAVGTCTAVAVGVCTSCGIGAAAGVIGGMAVIGA